MNIINELANGKRKIEMRIISLASGSSGNCYFVSVAETNIIVDCGISAFAAAKKLDKSGIDVRGIDAILVTHEHADHVSGAFTLAKRAEAPLFITLPTYSAIGKKPQNTDVHLFSASEMFAVGNVDVHPFSLSHDAADPVGFKILSDEGDVVFVTDTGIVSETIARMVQGATALALEFNHDPFMLEHGPYPQLLKERIASNLGHLSNSDAARLLAKMDRTKLKGLLLSHLSRSNNLPKLALFEAEKALGDDLQRIDVQVGDQYLVKDFLL